MAIKKVLLIEDSVIVQQVHCYMLKKLCDEVTVVGSGLRALELVENDRTYDIIFVDIGLPDISGFDLIKNLCTLYGSSEKPAIIVLTGYTGEKERGRCLQNGADLILYKPITINMIRECLLQYR